MNFNRIKSIALSISLGVATSSVAASAEYTDSTSSSVQLNELSVTAIKQGIDMKQHALSATSIGKHDVERYNIVDAKTASALVPNFFIPDYGSRITSSIYVRGLGARIDQPAVGLNIDNVPIMNKDNYDFDLLDIARVEMLRGAQGTLFGRNTMGGLINIYTISPLSYQGLRFLASYGSGNSLRAGASYYTKINSHLGVSASAYYRSTDGFFTNLHNGEKCDWERQGSGRVKIQWRPSSRVSIDNTLSLSVVRQGGYPYEYVNTGEINYNDTCFYRRTSVTDGLTIGLDLDNVTLSSITSYQYIDDNMTLDQDFLPLSYFTLTQAKREHAVTQDFVTRSKRQSAYQWLAGIFGFYKDCDMDAPVTFLDYGIEQLIEKNRNDANPYFPIRWDSRQFVLGSNFRSRNAGVALYHQSSYTLDRWKFTAGIRLDMEHAMLDYVSHCNTGYNIIRASDNTIHKHVDVNIDDPGSLSKTFCEVLPKIAVTYSLSNSSHLYALAAKGYKAGGFNTQMFSDVLQQRIINSMGMGSSYKVEEIITYKPEHSWTFEGGAHLEWLSGDLQADLSAFYILCTDQQLTIFPDGNTTGRIMTNAGRTRNWGIEAAVKAQLTQNLELAASYGYTNARFIEFNNGKEDFSGKIIPYAPQNTIFASANYTLRVGHEWLNSIVLGTNVRAVGKIYWNEQNSVNQDLYALLGASVRFEQRNVSLDFWSENLTDTAYRTFYFVSIGNSFLQRGKPRQMGVTLRVRI